MPNILVAMRLCQGNRAQGINVSCLLVLLTMQIDVKMLKNKIEFVVDGFLEHLCVSSEASCKEWFKELCSVFPLPRR